MTQITIYASTSYQQIYGNSTDYAIAHSTATAVGGGMPDVYLNIGQDDTPGGYYIYRSFIKFPTTDIPDNVSICTAYIAMTTRNVYLNVGYDVDIIKQNWSYYNPGVSTDIDTPYDGCLAGTKDVTWHSMSTNTTTNTTYNSPFLDASWISTTDYTYYSLRSSQDASSDPGDNDWCNLYHPTESTTSYRPALIVNYYEVSTSGNTTYYLDIDWSNSTNYEDEADRMLKFKIDRGRTRLIGRPGGGFEPYRVGRLSLFLSLLLDNSDGRYNPWNTSGALYGNLTPGKRMRFVAATSTDAYYLFTGYTSKLIPRGWNKTVTLECEDGLGILRRTENYITNENDTEPYYTVDNFFDNMLDFVDYPYSRDISTADPTSDIFAAHPIMLKDNGLSSAEDLANGAIGTIAAESDGTFAYHSIYESDTSTFTFTDSNIIKTPYFPNPWEYRRDATKLNAEYWLFRVGFNRFDFVTTDAPLTIGVGDTLTKEFSYIDTLTSYPGNWYGGAYPTTAFDVFVSTNSDLTGSTSTTDISYETTIYPEKLVFSITNSATDTQYVNKFTNYGVDKQCLQYENIDLNFGTTINDWTSQEFVLSSPYFSMGAYGYTDGYYSDYWPAHSSDYFGTTNVTKTQTARINKLGNLLYNYLSTDHQFPVLQMEGRPNDQFSIDVEKRVTYSSALLGTTDDYRVCGLSHQSLDTPQSVRSTFYLYPVIPSSTD